VNTVDPKQPNPNRTPDQPQKFPGQQQPQRKPGQPLERDSDREHRKDD
jgi:hypothetical protein